MKRFTVEILGLALVSSVFACGTPEESTPLATHQVQSAQATEARVVMPPLVKFREWNRDRPLVPPARISSHFVSSVAASPDDRTHFRAYGSDAVTGVIFYQVDGLVASDLEAYLVTVGSQIAQQVREAGGVDFGYEWGGSGELKIPLPIGPGPQGVPEAAVRVLRLARGIFSAIAHSVQGHEEH